MSGCQHCAAAHTSYLRGKHLCRCRLQVASPRGLVSVRQSVQDDHNEVWKSKYRLDGKSEVSQIPFLLQLEQSRQRGTQPGCIVSGPGLVTVGESIHFPTISSYRSMLGQDKRAESKPSLGSPPVLARQGVVHHFPADGGGGQEVATLQDVGLRLVHGPPSTSSGLVSVGRCSSYWKTRSGEFSELSEQSRELVEASWRPNTEATYSSSWTQWITWCGVQGVPKYSPRIVDVMNFLSFLFEK